MRMVKVKKHIVCTCQIFVAGKVILSLKYLIQCQPDQDPVQLNNKFVDIIQICVSCCLVDFLGVECVVSEKFRIMTRYFLGHSTTSHVNCSLHTKSSYSISLQILFIIPLQRTGMCPSIYTTSNRARVTHVQSQEIKFIKC